ncbi:hypothetical protein Tco_1109924 [Tanacetum coccineum]|uniref:Uncharacterized protein n=1 Tax=Tanacetum coccineum TaxID=301880 RepID=A0ABQ5III5_9ASTR
MISAWMNLRKISTSEHYRMYVDVFGLDVPLTQSQPTDSKPQKGENGTRHLAPLVEKSKKLEEKSELDIEHFVRAQREVEITNSGKSNDINNEEVEIINVVIHVNVNEEEVEITDEVYELKKREKGKIIEEFRSTPFPSRIRSLRIHTNLIYLDTEKLQELTAIDSTSTPSSSLPITNYKDDMGIFFEHLRAKFLSRKLFNTLTHHLQEVMVESLPIMVDEHVKEQVKKQVPEQVRDQVPMYVAEGLILERKRIKNRWLR